MLIITGLLILVFAPVFNSYRSDDAKKIAAIQKTFEKETAEISNLECSLKGKSEADKNAIVAQVEQIKQGLASKYDEISVIKKPMEHKRLIWLICALALIVVGLPFASSNCTKK